MNNSINQIDEDGHLSLPNWAKIAVGLVTTVAAVGVTVATGGAAVPILLGVAASTLSGAAIGYVTEGKEGAINGATDGFMWGGVGALAASAVGAIKLSVVIKNSGYVLVIKKDIFWDWNGSASYSRTEIS